MAVAYTNNMRQPATYWAPGPNDGFGGTVRLVAPVRIMCRWQDQASLVRGPEGQEVSSSAVVYVDRPLAHKGYLAQGDFTGEVDSDGVSDPLDHGAKQIITLGTSPSLSAELVLHKVWL